MAAPDEVEEIIEEFSDVGGAHKIIQAQLAEVTAEKNPQLFIVEDFEFAIRTDQQVVAIVVKRRDPDRLGSGATQGVAQTCAHLVGGVYRVGERENLVGTGISLPDQMRDAACEDGCFTRACARDQQ